MLIGDCSISESEGFSADLQCLPFIYVLGYPVGYESELVLLLFEPQYAYCAHLCNCCEEKNHYNSLKT